MSPWALNRLTQAIAAGAVIGYPTDTIWGFGCDPRNPSSVGRLLQVKQRGVEKGLILLASDLAYCDPFIHLEPGQRSTLQTPTAIPTTWLVAANEQCPAWIRGNHPTVAVRITQHPLLRFICERLQLPLVSTSANRVGKSTVRSALQMRRQFGAELDFIVTGFNTGGGKASAIKSLASGTLVRSAK